MVCEAKLRSSGEKKENFVLVQRVSILTPYIGCAVCSQI